MKIRDSPKKSYAIGIRKTDVWFRPSTVVDSLSNSRNFYKDCPDGKLTLKQFEHEYAKIMGKPTHRTADYVKHMFNVYDQDKNQFIDFKYVASLARYSSTRIGLTHHAGDRSCEDESVFV